MKQKPRERLTKTILRMRRENRTSIKNATIIFELNNKHKLACKGSPGRPFPHHAILLQLRNFSEDYADTVTRPLFVDQLLICSEGNALRCCPMYGGGPVDTNGTIPSSAPVVGPI